MKEEGKEKGPWDSALEQIRIQRLEKREGQVRKRLGGGDQQSTRKRFGLSL